MLFIELAKVQLFIHCIRMVVLGEYGIPAIPTHPSFPRLHLSFFRFTLFFSLFTPSLFLFILPTFVIRIDRRGCSYRPTRMHAPTDADIRTDRRGCSYRLTRMLVTTDADDSC